MGSADTLHCTYCGKLGFDDGGDGFYYCRTCQSQSQDVVDTLLQQPHTHTHCSPTINFHPPSPTSTPTPSAPDPTAQFSSFEDDAPADFGADMDAQAVAEAVIARYVLGVQVMINKQCEGLVDTFGVSPIICAYAGTLWLRFVATTGVFREGWADEAIVDSEAVYESQHGDKEVEVKTETSKSKAEPENLFGARAATIWLRSLKKKIPLGTSLAICFLACHLAREAVLPIDIIKWASEGKLFYLAAFNDMEKYIGTVPRSCPLTTRTMFRPSQVIGNWLEPMAGYIANLIGLQLPPVNFQLLVTRFLTELCIPAEKVVRSACRVYEWLMPPELWLSADVERMPTRVCVMSIVVVAMRIKYNIHGFGLWEMSLSGKKVPQGSISNTKTPIQESMDVICHLERIYYKLIDEVEYSKDLTSYLEFCSDVVYAGLNPSYEEENIAKNIMKFYADVEVRSFLTTALSTLLFLQDAENSADGLKSDLGHHTKRDRDQETLWNDSNGSQKKVKQEARAENVNERTMDCQASSSQREKTPIVDGTDSLIKLKADMEENWFHYMPPRKYDKRCE